MALLRPGIRNQGQNLGKPILIQIIIGEFPIKILLDNPVAVIQRKPLADIDDAFRVVRVQTKCLQNLLHKLPVLRNDTAAEPPDHSRRSQLQTDRKHILPILRNPLEIGL